MKACRANADLSIIEFAKKVGVSANTISNWESGKSEPPLSKLRIISKISGVPLDFIFLNDD